MRTALSRLSALVLLAASAACVDGVEAQDTFQKSVAVHGHLKLQISNLGGDTCIARSPNAAQATVSARVRVTADSLDDAQKAAAAIVKDPPVEQDGDSLRVGALERFHFDDDAWVEGVEVDYRVLVPEDTEVDASSVSGHTCVEDVAGPVHVQGLSGDVEAKNVTGAVDLETVSGDVLVDGAGKATVRTTSGDIRVSRVFGAIDAKAISGDVFLTDVGDALAARTTSGNVHVESAVGPKSAWQFDLVSGDVVLTLPEASAFHLEATTRSGQVQSDFPIVTRQAGDDGLVGDVGQNPTARITSASVSGNVRLQIQAAH